MQQADGFNVDLMMVPTLRSGKTGAIRKFLKEYAEYVTVWTERINEGVIPRRRAPKTMLRCADLDLRERIRKYYLNVEDGGELDEQAFRNYLLEKVAGARSEVRLDVILRGLRFDPYLKDPREKVGRVFQHVDKKLEQHGVVGTFQAKDIAKYIVRAVEPKELRERVEFELSTEEGKQYGRDLRMLYTLIVGKFTLWYALHPDGEAARPARRVSWTVTWRPVGRLRVASASTVVGPGTRLETAAVPGNFGPLENLASKECKTMVAVVSLINIRRSLNATDAKGMVTCLANARSRLRGMLHRERDISEMRDAYAFRRGNKGNNGLL